MYLTGLFMHLFDRLIVCYQSCERDILERNKLNVSYSVYASACSFDHMLPIL